MLNSLPRMIPDQKHLSNSKYQHQNVDQNESNSSQSASSNEIGHMDQFVPSNINQKQEFMVNQMDYSSYEQLDKGQSNLNDLKVSSNIYDLQACFQPYKPISAPDRLNNYQTYHQQNLSLKSKSFDHQAGVQKCQSQCHASCDQDRNKTLPQMYKHSHSMNDFKSFDNRDHQDYIYKPISQPQTQTPEKVFANQQFGMNPSVAHFEESTQDSSEEERSQAFDYNNQLKQSQMSAQAQAYSPVITQEILNKNHPSRHNDGCCQNTSNQYCQRTKVYKEVDFWKAREKTELCVAYLEGRVCTDMATKGKCSFAHGESELQKKVGLSIKYKTSACKAYLRDPNSCSFGNRCHYQHPKYDVNEWQAPTKILEENIKFTAMRFFQDIKGAKMMLVNAYGKKNRRLQVFRDKICADEDWRDENDYIDQENHN